MRRDAPGHERHQVPGAYRLTADDKSLGNLACLFVRASDHGRVGDRRMRQQDRFERRRGHLVPLVLDDFLEPVYQAESACAVSDHDVAGVHEAVGVHGGRGRLRIAQVTAHVGRAADQQFPGRAGWHVQAGGAVDDAAVNAGQRRAEAL